MSRTGRPHPALPYLAFGVCTLAWGSTFLFIRIGNASVGPAWGATMRLLLTAAILGVAILALRLPAATPRQRNAAIAFGVVDFGISLPLLYWGEAAVPSSVAGITFACMPILTAVFARLAGLEPLRPLKLLAGAIGLAGVTVLLSSEVRGHTPALPLLAVFLSAVTASWAGVLLKRDGDAHPLVTNAIAHAAGAPLCLAASFALHESHALPHTAAGWVPVVYLTLAGSVLAFGAYAWLVQQWSVVRINFVSVLTPVVAAVLGAAVAGERLGSGALLGAGIVLVAVVMVIAGEAEPAR